MGRLRFQGGDAVWEGLRVYEGRVLQLEEHLQRLQDSAKALAFTDIPSKGFVKVSYERIYIYIYIYIYMSVGMHYKNMHIRVLYPLSFLICIGL